LWETTRRVSKTRMVHRIEGRKNASKCKIVIMMHRLLLPLLLLHLPSIRDPWQRW
jgi:hypothetical protein